MKEEYVTHSQAKKLKKFGFDWDVNKIYNRPSTLAEWELLPWHPEYKNWNNEGRFYLSAPTLSLAQKWLREVKDVIVIAEPYWECEIEDDSDYLTGKWNFVVWEDGCRILCNYDPNKEVEELWLFDTYEQALSAGIDCCINLLMKNKYVKEENN